MVKHDEPITGAGAGINHLEPVTSKTSDVLEVTGSRWLIPAPAPVIGSSCFTMLMDQIYVDRWESKETVGELMLYVN